MQIQSNRCSNQVSLGALRANIQDNTVWINPNLPKNTFLKHLCGPLVAALKVTEFVTKLLFDLFITLPRNCFSRTPKKALIKIGHDFESIGRNIIGMIPLAGAYLSARYSEAFAKTPSTKKAETPAKNQTQVPISRPFHSLGPKQIQRPKPLNTKKIEETRLKELPNPFLRQNLQISQEESCPLNATASSATVVSFLNPLFQSRAPLAQRIEEAVQSHPSLPNSIQRALPTASSLAYTLASNVGRSALRYGSAGAVLGAGPAAFGGPVGLVIGAGATGMGALAGIGKGVFDTARQVFAPPPRPPIRAG